MMLASLHDRSAPAAPAEHWSPPLQEGRKHLRAGRHDEAISLLLPFSDGRDAAGEVRATLAEAYEATGHKHQARLLWLDVARVSEGGTGRHLWRLGCNAFERGNHAEAARLIGAYLAGSPGDLAAAERLLEVRLAMADLPERRAIYDRHIEDWPKTSNVLAVLAAEILRFDSKAEALRALSWAEMRWEGALPAAMRIAGCYERLGEPGQALAMLDRAAGFHPNTVPVLRASLRVQGGLGRPKAEIMAVADHLVALEPGHAAHHLTRARLLAGFRDWAGAADAFERALELDRSAVSHWRGLLGALGNLERDAAIDALLAEARSRFGGHGPDGMVDLAVIEAAAGDHGRAAALAGGAMANPRTRVRAREVASEALLMSGQYVRAWSYLSAAVGEGQAGPGMMRLAARCGAALRVSPPGAVPAFPAALFQQALLDPPPRTLIQPAGTVMLVTSSLAAGGAERQVALTAAGVARARAGRGGTVLVGQDLSPDRGRAVMQAVAETPGLHIEDLSPVDEGVAFRTIAAADPGARDALRLIAALPAKISRDVLKLYDCFRRHQPSLVHLWQDGVISAGSVAAVLAGVPRIVASMRNVVATEADRRRYRPHLKAMYLALAQRPEVRFTANSAAGASDYERWLGMTPGTVAVIRNGLETETVRARGSDHARQAARAELGVAGHELLVGGTFRLAPAKRPHLWLAVAEQVARRVPDSRFVIVGDGALRHELEGWVASRNLSHRITLAGRKNPVEPWIAAMDAMLLASEVEGLPNVLLEAQALGVPVVTTKAGGSGEAVLHGITGFLVDSDETAVLADAVAGMLLDPRMRGRARIGAPAFIEQRFGLQRMLADTLALYDSFNTHGFNIQGQAQ